MNLCPKCQRVLLRMASPSRRRYSRPPRESPRPPRKPRLSTRQRKLGSLVAVVFERLSQKENKGQILVVLALGLLMMLVAAFSAMRGEGEPEGKMQTKSLVYDADSHGRIGLYWMDDKANTKKATPEEIERCQKLHPDEAIPVCKTTYYAESGQ